MVKGKLGWVEENRISLAIRGGWQFPSFVSAFLVLLVLLSTCLPSFSQLTAQYLINFNGFNGVIDSFDSSSPTQSVWQTNMAYNGHYYGTYTNALRKDNAVVATDGQIMNVSVAKIYGYVDVGPNGMVSINNGGSVGNLSWIGPDPISPFNYGIQPGHMRDDMNIPFPDVAVPTPVTWLSVPAPPNHTIIVGGQIYTNTSSSKLGIPGSYTIGGIAYSLIITNRTDQPGTSTNRVYYLYPSQLNQSIFIDASNVVLYLPNGISYNSGDYFTLNTNANVQIYSGYNINTGNGLVNNRSQFAPSLSFYGLPSCTSITFGANPILTAAVYAPEASVSFNGGGSNFYDVVGVVTAHDITVNGHYNFHLDEFLWNRPPFPPLITFQPKNQAVPVGSDVSFATAADGGPPEIYAWFFNQTNLISTGTNNTTLSLTNVQLSDAGFYSAIVTNSTGSVTNSPAILFVYTNSTQLAAHMDVPTTDGFGNLLFNISGITGFDYVVQTSTDLTDWTPVKTLTAPFSFTATNVEASSLQFYRAVFVPTSP